VAELERLDPGEIEARSMEIIDQLLPEGPWSAAERTVVKRLVHASGDPTLALAVRFSESAIATGVQALHRGATVIVDTEMVRSGLDSRRLAACGCAVACLISDPEIVREARQSGRTRAACAMRAFGPRLQDAIVALGNAPTALREVLAVAAEGLAEPALVIGMPVGFVDAAQSKTALAEANLAFITVEGTRGGSPLAAATVNALLRLAFGES